MSDRVDLDVAAAALIRALADVDLRADRFTTGPGVAGINVWGPNGRWPLASVTISDNARFGDFAWGPRYEHTLPLSTPLKEVAAAIAATVTIDQGGDDGSDDP